MIPDLEPTLALLCFSTCCFEDTPLESSTTVTDEESLPLPITAIMARRTLQVGNISITGTISADGDVVSFLGIPYALCVQMFSL